MLDVFHFLLGWAKSREPKWAVKLANCGSRHPAFTHWLPRVQAVITEVDVTTLASAQSPSTSTTITSIGSNMQDETCNMEPATSSPPHATAILIILLLLLLLRLLIIIIIITIIIVIVIIINRTYDDEISTP